MTSIPTVEECKTRILSIFVPGQKIESSKAMKSLFPKGCNYQNNMFLAFFQIFKDPKSYRIVKEISNLFNSHEFESKFFVRNLVVSEAASDVFNCPEEETWLAIGVVMRA